MNAQDSLELAMDRYANTVARVELEKLHARFQALRFAGVTATWIGAVGMVEEAIEALSKEATR